MLVVTGASHRGVLRHATLSQINSAAYLIAGDDMVRLYSGRRALQKQGRRAIMLRSKDWNSALQDARVPVTEESSWTTWIVRSTGCFIPPESPPSRSQPDNG